MKSKKLNSTDSEAGFLIGFIILTLLTLVLASCSDDEKGPDTRAQFVGTYNVEDVSGSTGYIYYYDVTVTNGAGGELEISNFADMFNVPVKATVNGNSLTIKSQTFTNPSGKTIEVSGTGSLSNNILSFTYTTVGYLNYSGTCKANRK